MTNHTFKVGDLVILKGGRKPLKITDAYGTYCYARYVHNNQSKSLRYNEINLYEDEQAMSNSNTLYQIKNDNGTVSYGTHVGTNSSNQFLIEEKGTGRIILANKAQLEEVLPYTFSVRMNSKLVHFQGEPEKVSKGDFLLYTGEGADNAEIAYVVAVDTKNKTATKTFKGRKLVTQEI
jgi:hypothetical protein